MKYLKYINELFDSEDLKSKFEVPYLSGEIYPDIKKWKPLSNKLDRELNKIINEVPWLIEMNYRKSGNVLSIGFDNNIIYGQNEGEGSKEESVFYYFLIEIVRFRDEYSLNVYAKCYGNGQQIYNESIIRKAMPYKQMISELRRPVFNMLIDFNNFIKSYFGESHFSVEDKKRIVFNPNLN